MAKPMTTKDKIREWISDNLRYMLLIGAILLIVAAVLLVVHLVSSKSETPENSGTATVSSSTNNVPDKKTQVKAESKTETDSEAEADSKVETASDSNGSAENTQPSEEAQIPFAAGNVPEVSTLLEQYYTALGAKDMDGIRQAADNLTDEEQAQIEAENDVESYLEVQTYTVQGPSEGTYLAFVSSKCKYQGIETALPMLSEYYVYTAEDGSLKIMDDTDSDASVTEAMQAAQNNEEVKNLVEQVRSEYQSALDSDAALKAYVESLQ